MDVSLHYSLMVLNFQVNQCFPKFMFSCEFCEIFNNTFFYRTPPEAASERKKETARTITITKTVKKMLKRQSWWAFF